MGVRLTHASSGVTVEVSKETAARLGAEWQSKAAAKSEPKSQQSKAAAE